MVSFSKFIDGQRGTQLLLDTDGFLYSRRKDRDTPTPSTCRCQKYRTKKCPSTVLLTAHHTLTSLAGEPRTHEPGNLVAEKAEFRQSLKRKAADQHLSATQNLLTEASPTALLISTWSYLSWSPSPESSNVPERSPLALRIWFWNHHATIMEDQEYPRTSNMVEGFHRGLHSVYYCVPIYLLLV